MLSSGTLLDNRYRIIQYLSGGSFGDTYLAQDLKLPGNPHCVVKHLKPKDPDPNVLIIARRLFETEAQILYKLGKHDQIPQLFAHFEEKGEFYLVQEFVKGQDLTKEIITGKKLSESYAITLLQNILEILAFAHQQGVIHRDISPKNLMRRQQDGKIVLIDFGAVKEIGTLIVNAQGKKSLTIGIGTPGYMPSEQARGKPRLCSDVYAVGMIGIQALTGIPSHQLQEDPNTGEVIWRHLVSRVDARLADVLDKMVRDHFSQRYQNAGEALQALLSLSPPPPPTPTSAPPPPVPPTIISTNTTRRGLLQLAGFAGGGFVLALLSQNFLNNKSSSDFETVTVNSTGQITNHSQRQARVFTDNLADGITIDMVAIPGGSFVMGSPSTEAERDNDEGPQHNVNISPFFMGKYEVTQAQYEAVMGNNPSDSDFKGAKRPVENVNWDEAVEFCRKLTQKTGKTYRLPSEAEWEYACRAGTTTPFHFGDTITPDLVNYNSIYPYGAAPKGLYRQQTTDVGSFPPNAFGLYDMHGNVWEWCSDKWHDNYNGAPTDGSSWETGTDNNRVRRGGSWNNNAVTCRGAFRGWDSAGDSASSIGFRVAVASA